MFAAEPEDLSPREVADMLYGDPDLLDEIERQRVIRRPVSLAEITEDPAIQVRVGGLDADHLELLVQVLLNGGSFDDPVELVRDDDTGKLLLAAGFHRCAALRLALERADELVPITDKLDAYIHQIGGRAKALEIAEDDNLRHGLKLTNEDKFHIFERRIQRGHEWVRWSDRRLAAELGVVHTTVGRWRAELKKSSTGAFAPVDSPIRVSADGTVRDVSKIQTANQARQSAELESPPSPGSSSKYLDELQEGSAASLVTITNENESGTYIDDTEVVQNLDNVQGGADNAASSRSDWRTATRREIVGHLRQAAAGLRELRDSGADAMDRYADTLEEEWNLHEHD